MSLLLTVEPRWNHFFCGETVEILVRWHNATEQTQRVPDPALPHSVEPHYILREDTRQTQQIYRFGTRQGYSEDSPDEYIPLAPGETRDFWFPLNRAVNFFSAGTYELTGQAPTALGNITSLPVRFVVEPPPTFLFALGYSFHARGKPDLYGAWLLQGKQKTVLNQRIYVEKRSDLGEVSVRTDVRLAGPGVQATDPFSPWTNYSRREDMVNWIGWREGKELFALPSTDTVPLTLDLPSEQEKVVLPALMGLNSRALDVFVLGEGGRQLRMVRFPDPLEIHRKEPKILWNLPIPEPPAAIRTALSPPETGSQRFVVWLTPQMQPEPFLTISCLEVGNDGKPKTPQVVRLKNAFLFPNTVPGIHIDTAGRAHVAFVYLTNQETRDFSVAEIIFATGSPQKTETHFQRIGVLPSAARACAAAYCLLPGVPARREWVVLLENGTLLSRLSPQTPQVPVESPVVPLELLPLSQATYLVIADPKTGPLPIALHP